MEVLSAKRFATMGMDTRFVQDNQSLATVVSTLRWLHYQPPPFAQAKLVRCIRGIIFNVALDIGGGSPSYDQWIGAELSAENDGQLFIPSGYAHGCLTLESSTEDCFKVSDLYAPANDGGVLWNDQSIGIEWPLSPGVVPTLSGKDIKQPPLVAFESPFEYDGVPMRLTEV